MPQEPALIVFARAPIPGKTKTRLIPALGPSGAAELYRCFLLDTLALAARAPASVIVAAAAPRDLASLQSIVQENCPRASVIIQAGADLGERLANAVQQALGRGHSRTVVIGTDSPSLPPARISEALALSAKRDVVLGPSLDGGYYLIGLRAFLPALFRGIPWGSADVLVETLRRAQQCAASVGLLEPWYDVDAPETLSLLSTHLTALSLAGHPILCPHTWEYLRHLQESATQ